jgi:hypothetical protein
MYVRVLFFLYLFSKSLSQKMGCDGIRHAGEMERKEKEKKKKN